MYNNIRTVNVTKTGESAIVRDYDAEDIDSRLKNLMLKCEKLSTEADKTEDLFRKIGEEEERWSALEDSFYEKLLELNSIISDDRGTHAYKK